MKRSEDFQVLRSIDQRTKRILGRAKIEDDGWDIRVLLPIKTYALPDAEIEKWTTRPAIITDRLGGPLEPGPLIRRSGRLHIARQLVTVRGETVLGRVVELQLRHRKEIPNLWWVYRVELYNDLSGRPWVETSYSKDRILDENRSPVFGGIEGKAALMSNDDELEAFDTFLGYALKVYPTHSSWSRYKLTH